MKTTPSLILALSLATTSLNAALTITYGNDIGGDTLLRDAGGTPLTSGSKGAGDGAVIQIGYYSLATTESPFAGEWIALAGAGTAVPVSTIGDGIAGPLGDGLFSGSVIFSASNPGLDANTPIAIRFYDGTSIAGSTYYNAVTLGNDWGWIDPASGDQTLSLTIFPSPANAMTWEGGSGSAYRTTPAVVPEPGITILTVLGGSMIAARRKRRTE